LAEEEKTSLDGLYCKAIDNAGDCKCYATKKYSSLIDSNTRQLKIKKGLGNAMLNALDQGFFEIANIAKKISLQNNSIMTHVDVQKACSFKRLAKITKCNGKFSSKEVESNLNSYFGVGMDGLAQKMREKFQDQVNKPISKSNENSCLSQGELKEANTKADEDILNIMLQQDFTTYKRKIEGASFKDFIIKLKKEIYINLLGNNPLLGLILQDKLLTSKLFKLKKVTIQNINKLLKDKENNYNPFQYRPQLGYSYRLLQDY